MRKWWYGALLSVVLMCDGATAFADNTVTVIVDKTSTEFIASVYKKISFCQGGKLDPLVFESAYRGYLQLKAAGKLEKDILSVCDFSLSANVSRLWIIDLKENKVLYNTYVAHGQGSGEEFASSFSNRENSHQSSLGFYVTGETYQGAHGISLRLHGMDNRYNDAALDRGIVLHGAHYVCDDFIRSNKRLGRSWGCPAVANALAPEIIDMVKEGSCLFLYYPDKKYLSSSYWLNKKKLALPDQHADQQFQLNIPVQPEAEDKPQVLVN